MNKKHPIVVLTWFLCFAICNIMVSHLCYIILGCGVRFCVSCWFTEDNSLIMDTYDEFILISMLVYVFGRLVRIVCMSLCVS